MGGISTTNTNSLPNKFQCNEENVPKNVVASSEECKKSTEYFPSNSLWVPEFSPSSTSLTLTGSLDTCNAPVPIIRCDGLHSYQLGSESGLGENTVSGGGGLSEMTSFMGSEARERLCRGDAACHPHKEDHVTPSTADPDHTFQLFALWITHRRDFWSFVCSVRHAANF